MSSAAHERASVRSSWVGGVSNMSMVHNEKLQRAFEQVDAKTNALHKKLNLVYVSLLGFVLIGLCALGCIIFGVVEIVGGDSIFGNEGFGEVLTVLGTYFSIPFVFVITLFLVITMNNPFSRFVGRTVRDHHVKLLLGGFSVVYALQCTITNYYLAILTSEYTLIIVAFDIIGLALVLLYHRVDARGFIFWTLLFVIKLAIMWGQVYKTVGTETFWGPNGVLFMLFLSIPMVEIPLMTSYVRRPLLAGDTNAEANALLRPSLDVPSHQSTPPTIGGNGNSAGVGLGGGHQGQILSSPTRVDFGNNNYTEFLTPKGAATSNSVGGAGASRNSGSASFLEVGTAPSSDSNGVHTASVAVDAGRFTGFSARLAQMAEVEFVDHFVSHFGLYLNHVMHSLDLIALFNFAFIAPATTDKQREAPLPFRVLIAILFCVGFFVNNGSMLHLFYNREDVHIANIPFVQPIIRAANRTMRAEGKTNADLDPKMSYQRRLFQYMLLMLAVVDVPLLICRLELWAGQYAALSIFVAKNIKDIVDVAMLTLRVNENIRQNESGGGGGGALGQASGAGGAPVFNATTIVPTPILREPSL